MSGLILHLSVSQSHVFLVNSRLGHFSAPHRSGGPFSRSYRTNLPSSLAMIHSSTFGYSPRPPVSVSGTDGIYLKLRGFSWKRLGSLSGCPKAPGTVRFQLHRRICLPVSSPTPFNVLFRQYADLSSLRHPIAVLKSIRILTDCPSNTPFGFSLGPD